MSSRERILRMFEHREADRVPIVDRPWGGDTIARWHREGMPENVDYQDYFELDKMRVLYLDISPRFPEETIEETPEYIIHTTVWGETRKTLRSSSTTPQSLDFAIKTPDDWRRVKARITPSRDRIHWRSLKTDYAKWRHEGAFFMPSLFFGFDVTHSYMVGFETMLIALIEDPEWCREMFAHQLEVSLAQADMLWNEGYVFDAMRWPDDMGYKNNQFFSLDTYREVLKPFHQKAIDWAHAKGIPAYLHSCGNIRPFIPELAGMGLDGLNPLEVKAGMDSLEIKEKFGDRLLLHGGINTLLWEDLDAMEEVIRQQLPLLMKNGGYLFGTDHSIPSSVSAAELKHIIALVKEIGSY